MLQHGLFKRCFFFGTVSTRVCLHTFVPELFCSCVKQLHGCVFVIVWLKMVCGCLRHYRSHSPCYFEGNSFQPHVPCLCILVMNPRVACACLCGLLPCCFAWQYCTLRCAERPSFACSAVVVVTKCCCSYNTPSLVQVCCLPCCLYIPQWLVVCAYTCGERKACNGSCAIACAACVLKHPDTCMTCCLRLFEVGPCVLAASLRVRTPCFFWLRLCG